MFFDFGAGELIGLAVLAMILVGPDKLPGFAVQAAKMVKKLRSLTVTATNEIKENLGPGFENLQPVDLHPKTFIKKQLDEVLNESSVKPARKINPRIDPDIL